MKFFEFSEKVISRVIQELEKAEKYIKIAVFQLHHKDIFDLLNKKISQGVTIEIITLPYDSIHENVRDNVINLFKDIINKGAKIYFCKWNVGDPERTTTAVGRWYSFHGKFIVTDKSAIALSANFIQSSELDAVLVFENEMEKINEFSEKFGEILKLLIKKNYNYNGLIRKRIVNTNLPKISMVFELPPVIESNTHVDHWIRHYPSDLCPEDVTIEDKLYITPFDGRGRNLYKNVINEADKYVYLSTESFTDVEFTAFLKKTKLRDVDIRILTGATSMDFTDRMQKMLRELLAYNIKVRTPKDNLHAKLLITDKHLVVSSVNLNKMNLGFKVTKKYWRENTETITVCSDYSVVKLAKKEFVKIFNNSINIEHKLVAKIEGRIGNMFINTFGLRSKQEVKALFAKLVLKEEIKVNAFALAVGSITANLMRYFNKKEIGKNDFLMSLILFYLSERKHDYNQIDQKLSILDTVVNLERLLDILIKNNFVEEEDDFYKIRVESLFQDFTK